MLQPNLSSQPKYFEGPLEAWLRLAFVNLPAGRCRSALTQWNGPQELLDAAHNGNDAELLATPGVTPTTVERLRQAATRDLSKPLAAMENHAIWLLIESNERYPAALRAIPDPPPYLFVRGEILPQDEIGVAIVGTRHTTEYGRSVAAKLGGDLARRGITVVSGLARGVDTAAHRGALEAGGRTFACCGCGLDIVYPSDNKKLMEEITYQGACFSEFAPTVHPEAWHFPARNRIISGLSAGVIVVEAGEKSGALITSDFAMDQGREVFAVPGNIFKIQSRGAHGLIKQGATLIESANDVIEALNQRTLPFDQTPVQSTLPFEESNGTATAPGGHNGEKAVRQRAAAPQVRADLSVTENRVWLVLELEPRHIDDIADSAQMSAAEVNATLLMLELKGIARRLPGSQFVRAE